MNSYHPCFYQNTLKKILLIIDNFKLCNSIRCNLIPLNYIIFHTSNVDDIDNILQKESIDLILCAISCDRNKTPYESYRKIINSAIKRPVILIMDKFQESQISSAINAGIDDYIVQPFKAVELQARIKVRITNTEKKRKEKLTFSNLLIDFRSREVIASNKRLILTTKEFDLLSFLAKNSKQVFTRNKIIDAVWGARYNGYEHTVNSHINRLRSKFADVPSMKGLITTVWGVGYQFTPPSG